MTVFRGACLQSFDPENLYSTQCHLGRLVHIPPSPSGIPLSEERAGPGGRGLRPAALIRLCPRRADPDL